MKRVALISRGKELWLNAEFSRVTWFTHVSKTGLANRRHQLAESLEPALLAGPIPAHRAAGTIDEIGCSFLYEAAASLVPIPFIASPAASPTTSPSPAQSPARTRWLWDWRGGSSAWRWRWVTWCLSIRASRAKPTPRRAGIEGRGVLFPGVLRADRRLDLPGELANVSIQWLPRRQSPVG